jgi:hypothetical protein
VFVGRSLADDPYIPLPEEVRGAIPARPAVVGPSGTYRNASSPLLHFQGIVKPELPQSPLDFLQHA